jgi:CPA1 family monovalent cation:H+ antiporter
MRGVVSLAAALALPVSAGSAPFPGRNLIIFLTFCVIFATLVLQGLSLPAVIKLLGLREETYVADREEAQARIQVAEAAKARLEELSAADGATELQRTRTAQLSAFYDDRIRHFRSHLQGAAEEERAEIEHEVDHTLRRETLEAERATLVMMRTQNLINDDIYHRIETDIDLAETQLR